VEAVSVAHLTDEGIAEEPEGQIVGECHRKIAIGSDPAIRLVEKPVILR